MGRQAENHADNWEVIELPAIFEDSGNVLWREFWKKEELESVKASIPVMKWNARYQQNPTSEEGPLSSENGGISGRKTHHPTVITSFSLTIPLFPRKKTQITVQLPLGACLVR